VLIWTRISIEIYNISQKEIKLKKLTIINDIVSSLCTIVRVTLNSASE